MGTSQTASFAVLCGPVNDRPACDCRAGKAYQGDPPRHPSYLVHCFKPFNGETPHLLLADAFLTPPELFYVSAAQWVTAHQMSGHVPLGLDGTK
jgi:hypothetical protein